MILSTNLMERPANHRNVEDTGADSPNGQSLAVIQLFAQLERIDLLLQLHAWKLWSKDDADVAEAYLLSPEEIAARLTTPHGAPVWLASHQDEGCRAYVGTAECERLETLASRFGLSSFERDVVLLGLLPFFDSRYHALFASLQSGSNKTLLTFDLAMTLLGSTPLDRVGLAPCFLPQSPLRYCHLIVLGRRGEQDGETWTQTQFQTDPSVYEYLIGQRHLPPSLMNCAEWLNAADDPATCPKALMDALLAQRLPTSNGRRAVLALRGVEGSGRAMAIAAAAKALSSDTLELDAEQLPGDDNEARLVLTQALRETRMRSAYLVVRALDRVSADRPRITAMLSKQLLQPGLLVVFLCDSLAVALPSVPQIRVDMPPLDSSGREALLHRALSSATIGDLDIGAICRDLHFSRRTLPLIVDEAKHYQVLRDSNSALCESDLRKAARLHSRQSFGPLARYVEPRRTFDDLVVGPSLRSQLSEILIAARNRKSVLEKGFADKIGYGTGVSALFYGDSGTGKTMAAEVIAGQLDLAMIQIDLAAIVSKYIGETEKNLSRIFDLAERDGGVLFFDEADALFGRRAAVKDAHDRHANIEVSYLLQRLENHPGLVILATNNRGHLDEAFNRRFTFVTRFDFPDSSMRECMWRRIWPDGVDVANDVDFASLSLRADLTGANIRNIALLAAWLAEDEGTPIHERHIDHALRSELTKIGRLEL